jgi:hypothetical protein
MNETHDINRRKAFAAIGATVTAVATGAAFTASSARAAVGVVGSKLLTVGEGGEYSTIQDALKVATAGASATSPYVIFLLPGIYDLRANGGPITLPQWVTLAGAHRKAVEVWLENSVFLSVASNSSVSDMTFRYSGEGAALISKGPLALENFELSRTTLFIKGSGAAVDLRKWVINAWFYDLTIVTEGIGVRMTGGGYLWVYNGHITLLGDTTGTFHCGYFVPTYARLWLFSGFLGVGYGYPNISDPDQDVIGVYCAPNMRGRVHMHDIWSICRNDKAGVGGSVVNCIRIEALSKSDAIVRAFGCYMQAESGEAGALAAAVFTDGPGRFESHGSRVREFGMTQAYGGGQTGVSRYSAADNGLTLRQESGGLVLLDGSEGPFTLTLGGGWVLEGEQYIFKKVDAALNVITIQAAVGWTIEGLQATSLSTQYQTLHLRSASRTWWVT